MDKQHETIEQKKLTGALNLPSIFSLMKDIDKYKSERQFSTVD